MNLNIDFTQITIELDKLEEKREEIRAYKKEENEEVNESQTLSKEQKRERGF